MKFVVLLLSVLFGQKLLSAEVDHFSTAKTEMSDASDVINTLANQSVQEALLDMEKSKEGCDDELLYKRLRKIFANHSHGSLTKFILNSGEVPILKLPLAESIYSGWSIWDGLILGKPNADKSPLALFPLVQMRKTRIGVDKFEHMFGRGFSYFKKHYLKGKSLEKTFKSGIFGEKTIYGGNKLATGVFSYADLAANFQGMRFWNHVLQYGEDVLGEYYGPYVKCDKGRFVQNELIDFNKYIDEAMNESINCSKFPTKSTLKKFKQALSERQMNCPLSQEVFESLWNKYGNYAPVILNEDGPGVVDYFGEFKGVW